MSEKIVSKLEAAHAAARERIEALDVALDEEAVPRRRRELALERAVAASEAQGLWPPLSRLRDNGPRLAAVRSVREQVDAAVAALDAAGAAAKAGGEFVEGEVGRARLQVSALAEIVGRREGYLEAEYDQAVEQGRDLLAGAKEVAAA